MYIYSMHVCVCVSGQLPACTSLPLRQWRVLRACSAALPHTGWWNVLGVPPVQEELGYCKLSWRFKYVHTQYKSYIQCMCVYITCAVKLCVYKTVPLVVLECGAPHSLPCTNNHISLFYKVIHWAGMFIHTWFVFHPQSSYTYVWIQLVPLFWGPWWSGRQWWHGAESAGRADQSEARELPPAAHHFWQQNHPKREWH